MTPCLLLQRRAAAEAATAALESAKRSADEEAERASREKTKRQRLEDDHKVQPLTLPLMLPAGIRRLLACAGIFKPGRHLRAHGCDELMA